MTVDFWGVRGSVASPGPSTVRYGGNTACVSVAIDERLILVLDAGTGIRRLGEWLVTIIAWEGSTLSSSFLKTDR